MSRIELSRYFDIVERMQASNSLEELTDNCRLIADELEFDQFLFGAFLPSIEEVVVLDGFPHLWREHYDKNNCIEIDPTVRHCWSSTQPIAWEDLAFSRGRKGDRELMFMSESRDFGLTSGISVPIHGAGAEGGRTEHFAFCRPVCSRRTQTCPAKSRKDPQAAKRAH